MTVINIDCKKCGVFSPLQTCVIIYIQLLHYQYTLNNNERIHCTFPENQMIAPCVGLNYLQVNVDLISPERNVENATGDLFWKMLKACYDVQVTLSH